MDEHAFISYSRSDGPYVARLAEWLRAAGIPVWADQNIEYGEAWTQQIEKNLDAASAVIVVMTPSARDSLWVNREIARAERKNKPVFPLLLSGEPLLQFETTQYEDVSSGALPSPRFADSVAQSMGLTLRGLGHDLVDLTLRYRETGVLILGRFNAQGMELFSALRDELRRRGFVPVVIDFALPESFDFHEMLLLFSLAVRFVVADLSNARQIAAELAAIVPIVRVPVQPIMIEGSETFAMFSDLAAYPWVLHPRVYSNVTDLVKNVDSLVIEPADALYRELQAKRKYVRDSLREGL